MDQFLCAVLHFLRFTKIEKNPLRFDLGPNLLSGSAAWLPLEAVGLRAKYEKLSDMYPFAQ